MNKENKKLIKENPEQYLHKDNERLLELQERYDELKLPAMNPSTWSKEYISEEVNLKNFRNDCAYVWQHRDGNKEVQHILSALYVQQIDKFGLFDLLEEDGLFGAEVFEYDTKHHVSRDLLDSINEINFLERQIGLSQLQNINIVDIGAGYGRLAHRIIESLHNISHIYCVDAIPESTFLSEFYLEFRGVSPKASAIPIYEIEKTLSENNVTLATNIHSFSECTFDSINWWLDLLKNHSVRYLMIEPNAGKHGGTRLVSNEKNFAQIDYLPAIESRGYKLIAREPTYLNTSIQRLGVSPTFYYLFELA